MALVLAFAMSLSAQRTIPPERRILLVDDDEAFGYAAANALRGTGYKVLVAPNHLLALQALESPEPPDLMITDIVMPGHVNGFALARMARLRRFDLKVLYTTAYDISGVEAIGKVLRKPIPLELLALEAGLALASNGDLCGASG